MYPSRACLHFLPVVLLLAACGDGGSTPSGDAAVSPDPSATGSLEGVLRMCRMVHACGYTTARFGIPADVCTERALRLLTQHAEVDSPEQRLKYTRMVSCAASATTCDAYVRCVEFDTPCNGTVMPICVGNVAVRCSTPGGNHLPRVFDCSAVGQTCLNGACALPAGPNECATPGGGRCDGNVRAWCRPRVGGGNGEVREPCPAGTVCVGDGTGGSSPICQPMLTLCTTEGARCDGETAVLCLRDRDSNMLLELRSDCAAAGRRCVPDARGVASCAPRATGCMVPAQNAASGSRCDGTAVSVCLDGTPTRIDCAAVGRGACTMITPPAGLGAPYAGCSPL